ncbi:hypothetical protein MKW92_045369 [Papaver armeniacum]|nr:hypothetical protein MKW92_045369 [Papaver armeniacum]
MRKWEDYKPAMDMIGLQFTCADLALFSRTVLLQGMSPRVFFVYRQAIATLVLAPIAYFSQRKKTGTALGMRSFSLIFTASLIGVTMNQNIYFEGLYLTSSSIASAMGNLLPAISFLLAALIGFNNNPCRRAFCIAFMKGPKLLNTEFTPQQQDQNSILFHYFNSTRPLEVLMTASYPNHLCLPRGCVSLQPCNHLLSHTFWNQILIRGGVIGSAFSFFVQAWCISLRGTLFFCNFQSSMYCHLLNIVIQETFDEEVTCKIDLQEPLLQSKQ